MKPADLGLCNRVVIDAGAVRLCGLPAVTNDGLNRRCAEHARAKGGSE